MNEQVWKDITEMESSDSCDHLGGGTKLHTGFTAGSSGRRLLNASKNEGP